MTAGRVRKEPGFFLVGGKMGPRAVDWTLFALVLFEFTSGLGSFLVGSLDGQWLFVLHALAGLAMILLLVWKFRRVYRRVVEPRRWQPATAVSLLAGAAVVTTLATALVWVTAQRPVEYPNGMILHTSVAILLVILYLVHFVQRFRPLRKADFAKRRTFLGLAAVGASGGLLWGVQETANRLWSLPGARRRFTGSRRSGSPGEPFPVTMWMFDNPAPLDFETWRLRVTGAVEQEQSYSWVDVQGMAKESLVATLDCTGGWYTEQAWHGIVVGSLLDAARPAHDARYVSFVSVTGYRWSLPLAEARAALLATSVAGAPLVHGHGAPLRLVAPGRRGFQWVKWVVELEVRREPDVGQWGAIFVSSSVPVQSKQAG